MMARRLERSSGEACRIAGNDEVYARHRRICFARPVPENNSCYRVIIIFIHVTYLSTK